MKKLLLSLLLLSLLNIATAQQDSLNQNQPVDTSEVFTVVEEMPILLSCDSLDATHDEKKSCSDHKFFEYIQGNMLYPLNARRDKAEGIVIVKFIVNTDGSVGELEVVRPVHPALDEQAKRVISQSPAWRPGYHKGRAVRVRYAVPVRFKLQ